MLAFASMAPRVEDTALAAPSNPSTRPSNVGGDWRARIASQSPHETKTSLANRRRSGARCARPCRCAPELPFAIDHFDRLVERLHRHAMGRRVQMQPLPGSPRGDRISSIVAIPHGDQADQRRRRNLNFTRLLQPAPMARFGRDRKRASEQQREERQPGRVQGRPVPMRLDGLARSRETSGRCRRSWRRPR